MRHCTTRALRRTVSSTLRLRSAAGALAACRFASTQVTGKGDAAKSESTSTQEHREDPKRGGDSSHHHDEDLMNQLKEIESKEQAFALSEKEMIEAAYALLNIDPKKGGRLAEVKIKFLMNARLYHPELEDGGDVELFVQSCLAYQTLLRSKGLREEEIFDTIQIESGDDPRILSAIWHKNDIDVAARKLGLRVHKYDRPRQMLPDEDPEGYADEMARRFGRKFNSQLAMTPTPRTHPHLYGLAAPPQDVPFMTDAERLAWGRKTSSNSAREALHDHGEEKATLGADATSASEGLGGEATPKAIEHQPEAPRDPKAEARLIYEDLMLQRGSKTTFAAVAAQVSTEMMEGPLEQKQQQFFTALVWGQFMNFVMLWFLMMLGYKYVEAQRKNDANGTGLEHLNADTMLPWWGNDMEYERSVKRLYLEEWRNARAASRRASTYEEGLARESVTDIERKKKRDVQIFDVSEDHLLNMQQQAKAGMS